jgi:predicted NAD/FAD-binding protein
VRATDESVARAAGELLAVAGGEATIDAIVVATAALEAADVLTADTRDLTALGERAGVRIFKL